MAHEQSKLVKQVVSMLLTQFKNFPKVERSYIVIASIEALAWISAMETVSHCKEAKEGPEEANARIRQYSELFSSNAARGLPDVLQMRISAAEATVSDPAGVKGAKTGPNDKSVDTSDEIAAPSPESVLAGGSS